MISQSEVITIMQNAIFTTIKAAAPMLIIAIAIGLIVSIFQATTQINEQTLSFAPKFIAILLALLLFGGFILNTLEGYTTELYRSILSFLG